MKEFINRFLKLDKTKKIVIIFITISFISIFSISAFHSLNQNQKEEIVEETKVDNENNILKEQLQLIQEKCDNLQQIQELSSEKLNTEIEKLSKQIQNSSDFILKHCPEKYEQFKIILRYKVENTL